MRQEMTGFWDGSGISWTICKQFAPRSRQITTSTPHHSKFTGWTLFLTPNQQCQSTDGQNLHSDWLILLGLIKDKMRSLPQHTAQYLAIQQLVLQLQEKQQQLTAWLFTQRDL